MKIKGRVTNCTKMISQQNFVVAKPALVTTK